MASANYTGKSAIGRFQAGGKEYVTCYNDTGSTISNGAIKVLSPKWLTGIGVVMALTAAAENDTETNEIGIVANNASGGIADGSYGNVLVRGKYGDASAEVPYGAATTGVVAANDQLEVIDAGVAFIDQGLNGGGVLGAQSCAVAIALVATNVWEVYLIGKQSAIAAS